MTAASPKTDELVEKIARAINDSLIRQYVKSKRWEGAPDVIVGFDETAAARACLAEIEAAGMVIVDKAAFDAARDFAKGIAKDQYTDGVPWQEAEQLLDRLAAAPKQG